MFFNQLEHVNLCIQYTCIVLLIYPVFFKGMLLLSRMLKLSIKRLTIRTQQLMCLICEMIAFKCAKGRKQNRLFYSMIVANEVPSSNYISA